MTYLRLAGFALLVFGGFCLYWGLDLSDTFSNRFMKEMAGEYPDETKQYIFGGLALIVVGIACLVMGFRRKS